MRWKNIGFWLGALLLLSACAETPTVPESPAPTVENEAPREGAAVPNQPLNEMPPDRHGAENIAPAEIDTAHEVAASVTAEVAVAAEESSALSSVGMERRYLFTVGDDAAWLGYNVFVYLLMEPEVKRAKFVAALRAYVCGYGSTYRGPGSSGEKLGVFIAPMQLSAAKTHPSGRNEELAWAIASYDHDAAREMVRALFKGKIGQENGPQANGIYFVVAAAPLSKPIAAGAQREVFIVDITRLDQTEIGGWIFDRIQDIEQGKARGVRDFEQISMTFTRVATSAGRDFGSVIAKVLGISPAAAGPVQAISCQNPD
jgi:hypothetical protein